MKKMILFLIVTFSVVMGCVSNPDPVQENVPPGPGSAQSLYKALQIWDDPNKKLDLLNTAVGRTHDSAFILNTRGEVFMQLGDSGAAKSDFTAAVQLEPDFARAWFNLAQLSFEEQNFEAGMQYLDRAVAADPDDKEALFKRAWYSFDLYYKNQDMNNKEIAERYVKQAFKDFSILKEKAPSDPYVFVGLAQYYRLKGSPEKALDYFDKAVDLAPDDFYIIKDKAYLLREMGRNDEALSEFTKVADHLPWEADVLYQLAELTKGIDKSRALAFLEQAIALCPDCSDYLYLKARILSTSDYTESKDLLNLYDQIIRLDPWLEGVFTNRGVLKLKSEQYDAAAEDFRRALEYNRNDTPARMMSALIHVIQHNGPAAVETIEPVFEYDMNNPVPADFLFSILELPEFSTLENGLEVVDKYFSGNYPLEVAGAADLFFTKFGVEEYWEKIF